MLIPNKGTRNSFRPSRTCVLIIEIDLSMTFLKIEFGLNVANAQVVQVIKVDL